MQFLRPPPRSVRPPQGPRYGPSYPPNRPGATPYYSLPRGMRRNGFSYYMYMNWTYHRNYSVQTWTRGQLIWEFSSDRRTWRKMSDHGLNIIRQGRY